MPILVSAVMPNVWDRSANSFDELYSALQEEPTYIDNVLFSLLKERIETIQPELFLISVPFPGNLYAAFRSAQWVRKNHPNIKISMGGGFPNTELRSLSDARVFEFFDYITLDDGELPVELLVEAVCHTERSRDALMMKIRIQKNFPFRKRKSSLQKQFIKT